MHAAERHIIRAVGVRSGIHRRVGLLSVVVLACLLAVPAIASASSWTAVGSSETLTLSASYERRAGEPMSVYVEGTADGLHRLFVYGEPYGSGGGCGTRPFEEGIHRKAVALALPEGEPLAAGPFSKTFVTVPEPTFAEDVCAYLDTSASAWPDVIEAVCFVIPEGTCYIPLATPPELIYDEERAKEIFEGAEAERKHRAEAKQAESLASEEVAARQVREEAERRHATEEAERKAREANGKQCKVPQLRRHTLAGARRLLRDADCRLGRVTTRHHGHGTLVVQSQSPERGKTLPQGSAVSVVLEPRTA